MNSIKFQELKSRKCGEVDHPGIFSSQLSKLCMSDQFSDVTFEIQDEKIPGHAAILAARSEYFRALLFGGFAESKQKLIILKVSIKTFKALLTYIYSGRLSLSEIQEENILDALVLVHQYGCTELELSISEYLSEILSLNNVCAILNTSKMHDLEALQKDCHKFLDINANDFLVHESFTSLSEEALKDILRRDTFFATEFRIFTAVSKWCKHNPTLVNKSVVSNVRLPLISLEELFKVVRVSGIFDPETLLEAINEKTTSTSLAYRKASWLEENVATEKYGARVTRGDCGSTCLDGNVAISYTKHQITENRSLGIVVELGSKTIINHIKILLLDRDNQNCYSYFIDVCDDKTEWERVVDHQSYRCRSWQFLYFPSRAVRYIKLVGTYNSKDTIFEVVSLEAYYTAKLPKMINGVVAPTKNIATIPMGAVVDNTSSSPQYLLNGDINKHNRNMGFTFHKIGTESILIRLGQPYVIGSMRLLLLDSDDRKYSYYIETSMNQKDWKIVVDKRRDLCRSWQNFVFERRAMVFIKIVGTKNAVNALTFNCVHFECPSQNLKTISKEVPTLLNFNKVTTK